MLHVDDGLKSNYILVRRSLEGNSTDVAALVGERPYFTLLLFRLGLPWEKAREVRRSKFSTVNIGTHLRGIRRETLSRGEEIVGSLPGFGGINSSTVRRTFG